MKRPVMAALVGAGALALLLSADGCASSGAEILNGDTGDAELPTDDVQIIALCPSGRVPTRGSTCDLPEGTTCYLGKCSDTLALCRRGTWQFSSVPPVTAVCPLAPPEEGSACPTCWPPTKTCVFGCESDAGGVPTLATCDNGRWSIETAICPSAADAGAD